MSCSVHLANGRSASTKLLVTIDVFLGWGPFEPVGTDGVTFVEAYIASVEFVRRYAALDSSLLT